MTGSEKKVFSSTSRAYFAFSLMSLLVLKTEQDHKNVYNEWNIKWYIQNGSLADRKLFNKKERRRINLINL